MITVAGGIILAVLFFALLPYLIVTVGWVLVTVLSVGLFGTVAYLLWSFWSWGKADPISLGIMCIALGGIIILHGLFPQKPTSEDSAKPDKQSGGQRR
jgi:hypothetical protein